MSDVKILKTDNTFVTIPEENLENFRRLNGDSILEVIRENNQSYEEILDTIDNEDVVVKIVPPVNNDRKLRKEELMHSDKDVLKLLASELADKKGVKKLHHAAGVEKLADFIMENE